MVVATDRYLAEDALELIEVDYRLCRAVVDPRAALDPTAPLLHEASAPTSPATAPSATATRKRPSPPPRTASRRRAIPAQLLHADRDLGVVADYDPARTPTTSSRLPGAVQHPPVMARALKVPGNRLRLRTPPDSGGSFGVKQGVFPYIVLMGVAARIAGAPVKWIEDRLEHLTASVSATNRATSSRPRSMPTAASARSPGTRSRMSARTFARPSPPRSTACTAI